MRRGPREFLPPPPARVRGTVWLFTGRGDSADVYERFAHRLTVDGYRVLVGTVEDVTVSSDGESADRPVVVGVDAGAWDAIALASSGSTDVAGVVLVGLPGPGDAVPRDWETEVAARASCPTQQGKLRLPGTVEPGSLVPENLPAVPADFTVQVQILALHGTDDPISPFALAGERYAAIGCPRLISVDNGRHDVLNSVHHRSVAAEVVQFLEHASSGADMRPLVEVILR